MFVRPAREDEVDEIVEMAGKHVAEVRSDYDFDADLVRQEFWRYLDRDDPIIAVCEHAGSLVGYTVGSVGRFRFVDRQFFIQEVIYVRPEHRGSRAAVLLTKNLIAEAERRAIPEILGGNDFGFNPDRTKRFLEHFGFEAVGYCMRRRV